MVRRSEERDRLVPATGLKEAFTPGIPPCWLDGEDGEAGLPSSGEIEVNG